MDIQQMLDAIQQQSRRQLNQDQITVVTHGTGPLWVIAGPGSGKTEVLVLRCLKLTCVDEVPPKSIILTTFTEKAAKNMQDRLAIYKSHLDQVDTNLRSIDLFQLRVGTLHSLCNDIMQEYRYLGYQNYRLLDEIDQLLFVYEHSILATSNQPRAVYLPFWQFFDYLVNRYNRITGYRWSRNRNYLPHRWLRANAAVQLFNRIVEDRIDIDRMRNQGGVWATLADAYETYRDRLENYLCCDFAHLQLKFLEFLRSPLGAHFLDGDGSPEHPGIQYVLVDEYQDTNPIQEEIYLELARRPPHNLCVVGDDDQALYRFRGGTVECMVNFDQACQRAWGSDVHVTQVSLSINYRSHLRIVDWCDEYIRSFTVMNLPRARVPNKPSLSYDPQWQVKRQAEGATIGSYPCVSFLVGQNENEVADRFADLVEGLLQNQIVQDPNQCVLLLKSTRHRTAGPYQTALENRGIRVYNPRARTFLEQQEVQTALGALVTILDPNTSFASISARGIRQTIQDWVNAYNQIATTSEHLRNYVNQAVARIQQIPAGEIVTQVSNQGVTTIPATIQEMFYHIISFEPFITWQQDPEQANRLGRLSKVLESYCALPFPGRVGSTRGTLFTDPSANGQIHAGQLGHLYYALIGLLVSEGLNDPEEEEIICPPGRFPIMTVHQAKGLEFPFVFVAKTGVQQARIGAEFQLEDQFRPFRTNPAATSFTAQQRAEQDYIRFFYVAYSRAQYALVLLTTANELRNQGLGFGGYGRAWFEQQVQRIP